MGNYEREKGKRGERELANLLKTYGYDCRRGQQYCGFNGNADVIGLPGIYIECRRVERLNIVETMEKTIKDAVRSGNAPTVFHRRNGKEWLVTMRIKDWLKIYGNSLQNSTD